MEITVRFIPMDQGIYKNPKTGQTSYFTSGNRPALCFDDGKRGYAIINTDEAVEVTNLPLETLRGSRLVRGTNPGEASYDPKLFAEHIISFKRFKPITSGVHKFLKLLDESPLPSEEEKTSPSLEAPTIRIRTNLVQTLARELDIDPAQLRKTLRKKGLKAPYTDETAIRKALEK